MASKRRLGKNNWNKRNKPAKPNKRQWPANRPNNNSRSNNAKPPAEPAVDAAGLLDRAEVEVTGRNMGLQDPSTGVGRGYYAPPPTEEDRPAPKRDDS